MKSELEADAKAPEESENQTNANGSGNDVAEGPDEAVKTGGIENAKKDDDNFFDGLLKLFKSKEETGDSPGITDEQNGEKGVLQLKRPGSDIDGDQHEVQVGEPKELEGSESD